MRKVFVLLTGLFFATVSLSAENLDNWDNVKKLVGKKVFIYVEMPVLSTESDFANSLIAGTIVQIHENKLYVDIDKMRDVPSRDPISIFTFYLLLGDSIDSEVVLGSSGKDQVIFNKKGIMAIMTQRGWFKRFFTGFLLPREDYKYARTDVIEAAILEAEKTGE